MQSMNNPCIARADKYSFERPWAILRVLRTSDCDIAFESGDVLWVTVELGSGFKIDGRASGRAVDRIGSLGSLCLDPPGGTLDLSVRGTYRIAQIALPFGTAARIASEDHGLDGPSTEFHPVGGRLDWPLASMFCRLSSVSDREAEAKALREIVAHLAEHHSSARPRSISLRRAGLPPAVLRRIQDLSEVNLGDVTVAAMAAEAGLSPFHFAPEFKRMTRQTPWSYVTSRRLARALELLGDRDLPMEVVAQSAGFADASHLSHRLKAELGCSPAQARIQLLP